MKLLIDLPDVDMPDQAAAVALVAIQTALEELEGAPRFIISVVADIKFDPENSVDRCAVIH